MIYLLSQILLSLALAALLGGALGWLGCRARAGAAAEALRRELAQRTRLLAEARGDVQMLGDDFEELRSRSREEIDSLRAENRELPVLAGNLEKSQLMVRQLMQRHDAQLRELNARNGELAEQLATMRAQADVRERAHAELESARLRESGGETDEAYGADGIDAGDAADAGDAGAGTLDEVMEVDANLAAELRDDDEAIGSSRARRGDGRDLDEAEIAPLTAATDVPAAAAADADDDVPSIGTEAGGDVPGFGTVVGVGASDENGNEEGDEDEDDEANATLAIDILPADLELAFDLDDRDAPLFDPVDRQDDLQRLFGIGPITEKALNTLGITSYSQLAELERHEIEKIADALQIVPERIEKDDWVGNARRQLEDVLEQL